jgi:hypothetical protein
MANEIDFLPFATGGSANVESQATFAADPTTTNGFASGLAQSAKLNKVWRQSSFISAAVANFISNQLGESVLDNGNLTTIIAQLTSAIMAAAAPSTVNPTRIYTANTTLVLDPVLDYAVAINTTTPGAFAATLPSAAAAGKEYVLEDVKGTLQANNVTVSDQGGLLLSGEASFVMNANFQSVRFRKYTGLWSAAPCG